MTARTHIGEPQRVQRKGLSLFARQTAAAYEIHLIHLREQPCPTGAGLRGGHGLIHGALGGGAQAQSRLTLVVLLPALGSQASEVGLAGPPSRRARAAAGLGVPRDLEEYRP